MFKALIDTYVWLDLAKDRRQAPLLDLIDEMIRLEMLGLIVPRIVLEEFKNNKERVAQESSKSLSAHFRLVREALNKVGGEKERLDSVLAYLDGKGSFFSRRARARSMLRRCTRNRRSFHSFSARAAPLRSGSSAFSF
jgi:hypothetical protein